MGRRVGACKRNTICQINGLGRQPISQGAGVVVVKKIDGEWHTFAMWARGGYDIPKGHLEDGDTYLETAIRECEEECGINDLNFQWGTGSIVR